MALQRLVEIVAWPEQSGISAAYRSIRAYHEKPSYAEGTGIYGNGNRTDEIQGVALMKNFIAQIKYSCQ